MPQIEKIKKQLHKFPIEEIKNGFKIKCKYRELTPLSFEVSIEKIILPLREGEFIKKIKKLPLDKEYSISYPGTASMKSIILFTNKTEGIFIGGVPTYEFAKIKIKRINSKKFLITYNSTEHELFFLPFKNGWRWAADRFKKYIGTSHLEPIARPRKYFLQIGVKDSFGNCGVKHFDEFTPLIDYFYKKLGPGHIVHFFGTNKDGFDRMSPDYTIAPELGGRDALKNLIKYTQDKGFLTSHHYNPRIADNRWIAKRPEFKKNVVRKKNGSPVIEKYKDHAHYFMNPNHQMWFNRCMRTVKYLRRIGFDYIQLDQFTYQRNFFASDKPLQLGYKKMIEEFYRLGINFWLEGVSDIHRIKEGNFYQILTRDVPQVWEDNESRRGYPYGVSYPSFFMYMYPDSEVSYQLVTEKNHLYKFKERLNTARKINVSVYDLQMTFYGPAYMKILKNLIKKIKRYDLTSKEKDRNMSLSHRTDRWGILGNIKAKKGARIAGLSS